MTKEELEKLVEDKIKGLAEKFHTECNLEYKHARLIASAIVSDFINTPGLLVEVEVRHKYHLSVNGKCSQCGKLVLDDKWGECKGKKIIPLSEALKGIGK